MMLMLPGHMQDQLRRFLADAAVFKPTDPVKLADGDWEGALVEGAAFGDRGEDFMPLVIELRKLSRAARIDAFSQALQRAHYQ